MTVITTAPSADVVQAIDAIERAASDAALVADELRISHVEPGDFGRASRGADAAPYWGGAKISTDLGGCTTGFYLNSAPNGTVMVTAGHCYGGNGKSTTNGDHSAVVGTSEGWSRPDPDLALIDGQLYDHYSYSWNDQTTHKVISAASNPTTGVVYCQMGAWSLRRCSAYSALDVNANYLGGVTRHLAYTSNPQGPDCYLAQPGDSGGGVYRELSGGTLGARGIVVASGSDANSCARWDHKLQTITSFYSAAVVTTP